MKFTIENYIKQHNLAIENLDHQEIKNGIKLIQNAIDKGKRIAVCGNGGSAVAASHYITDWNKMVYSHTKIQFEHLHKVAYH